MSYCCVLGVNELSHTSDVSQSRAKLCFGDALGLGMHRERRWLGVNKLPDIVEGFGYYSHEHYSTLKLIYQWPHDDTTN